LWRITEIEKDIVFINIRPFAMPVGADKDSLPVMQKSGRAERESGIYKGFLDNQPYFFYFGFCEASEDFHYSLFVDSMYLINHNPAGFIIDSYFYTRGIIF
jgi:hypothetical protein